jgi:hypothetical protein
MFTHAWRQNHDNPYASKLEVWRVTQNTTDESQAGSPLTRRDFLLRSGQIGWLFSVLGSPFSRLAVPARRQFAELMRATHPPAGALTANLLTGFQWRTLGPFRGGRVAAASGVPGRVNEFYFGSVNGGVWKSIDAVRVRRVEMSNRRNEDDVRIVRIDGDLPDVLRAVESEMSPALTGVGRLVHAVAVAG